MGGKAVVLGASGFTGGELFRLLSGHRAMTVVAVGARGHVGTRLAALHPNLVSEDRRLFPLEEAAAATADVCFSCLVPGALSEVLPVAADLVIDLADDFRGDAGWTYGLTEFARSSLVGGTQVANPGCYPTAALLSLVPFARAGVITGPVVIDALSGFSGAGRRAEDRLMLAGQSENAGAYGTSSHRHVPEIERGLLTYGGLETTVSFTPHLVPMSRGVLVTARAPVATAMTSDDATGILQEAYASETFVHAIDGWPQTKHVSGSNHAHVAARVDEHAGFLICSAAIDNLGKGAAGQAIQNANVAFGIDETEGLTAVGVWP